MSTNLFSTYYPSNPDKVFERFNFALQTVPMGINVENYSYPPSMLINGAPIEQCGARLLGTPMVTPIPQTHEIFIGKNRSTLNLLGTSFGVKRMRCSIAFVGFPDGFEESEISQRAWRDIQLRRSVMRAALSGKVDLYFGKDDFCYFAVLDDTNIEFESEHNKIAVSHYQFTVVQHDVLCSIVNNEVQCTSTIPLTDCRISVNVGADAETYTIQGVTFFNVAAGDLLVVDSMDYRVTRNGIDAVAKFLSLPQLKPGANFIESPDVPTIEYYPTYM